MSRYNCYYPGNMQAAGRNMGSGRMRMGMRAENSAPSCPPVVLPQPPALCCEPTPGQSCTSDPLPVAMAYVSWQNWHNTYDLETALCRGTIFPCLDLPFLAYKGANV